MIPSQTQIDTWRDEAESAFPKLLKKHYPHLSAAQQNKGATFKYIDMATEGVWRSFEIGYLRRCTEQATEIAALKAKLAGAEAEIATLEADSDWFYKLQFICRVLSNGSSGNDVDWQTALGMARSLRKDAWLSASQSLEPKPITAEDVTDEMWKSYYKTSPETTIEKSDFAAAVNAYLGVKK